MSVHQFASLTDFLAAVPTNGRMRSESFTGYQTMAQARANLFNGSKTAQVIADSCELMDRLDADSISSPGLQWRHAVAGAIPCVPSYLANSPEAMRAPYRTASNSAPVRVFASVCVSADRSADEIARRGTAILALCRKLTAMRPVELYIYADIHGKDQGDGTGNCAIPVIRVDASPIDLASASYAMGNPGFLRGLCFPWADQYGFSGAWAWNTYPGPATLERVTAALGAGPDDLIIQGTVSIANEEQWVRDNIARFSGEEASA